MRSVSMNEVGFRFLTTPLLFQDITLTLNEGDLVAVCGPSGCGKSTLLSLLAGWQQPTLGTVTHCEIRRIGWVFQNPYGMPHRSALDHVVYPLLVQGYTRRQAIEKAQAILDEFNLQNRAMALFSTLSGGEAQRLMLARAVSAKPDLLLVDEPTAQLDITTSHSVNATLTRLAGHGMIVVIATHDADTRKACSRVIDIGKYIDIGTYHG